MAGSNRRSDEAKKYHKLYKLARWLKERVEFMYENPTCEYCARRGEYGPAEVVDHVKPHKGDLKLFWDWDNWQSLCNACHNGEKQREEKGKLMMRFDDNGFPLPNASNT